MAINMLSNAKVASSTLAGCRNLAGRLSFLPSGDVWESSLVRWPLFDACEVHGSEKNGKNDAASVPSAFVKSRRGFSFSKEQRRQYKQLPYAPSADNL